MNKILPLLLLGFVIVFSACKKDKDDTDDDDTPPYTDMSHYYPLAVGNYWVYQNYSFNQEGEDDTRIFRLDTATVLSDTMINGNKYFKINTFSEAGTRRISYYRDSLNHLIDHLGKTVFSAVNFTDTFEFRIDTNGRFAAVKKMDAAEHTVTTPAGTFTGLNAKNTYTPTSSNSIIRCTPGYLKNDNIYAPEVGLVLFNSHYSIGPECLTKLEWRLYSYHLN